MAKSCLKQRGSADTQEQSIRERAEAARAAASRHLPASGLSVRETHLSRLEGQILHVLAWASSLKAIGTSPNMLEPESVLLIGNALDTLAGELRDEWEGAWDAVESRIVATVSETLDELGKRQASEIPLGSLSIGELGNLYEEFGATADRWQAVRCQPFCHTVPTYDASASGVLADLEANRAGFIKDRIAQEARSRVPKDERERDEILSIRLRDELRCEGKIRDRRLLSQAAEAWS